MLKKIKINRKINCKKGFVPKLLLMVRDLLCKMKRTPIQINCIIMADYHEELSEIESEVDRLTRQVSGYERVGQSTPKYMATGERQSVITVP
jgi:hypothetical protein